MSARASVATEPVKESAWFQIAVLPILVAAVSYLAAVLGGAFVIRPEIVWPMWPGCAFLVAILLLTPRKIWPELLVAGLVGFAVYDVQTHLPLRAIVLLLVSDTLEILFASLALRYFLSDVPRLNKVKNLALYLLVAVVLAPVPAAVLGALAHGPNNWMLWRISFFTEALALLTVTPAILGWVNTEGKSFSYWIEAVALTFGLLVLGYFTFVAAGAANRPVLLYSLVPLLLWSALRFGTTGVSTSMLVIATLCIRGAVLGDGPFAGEGPLRDVFSLQLFLLFATIPFMLLAALIEERNGAAQELRESETRFRLLADTAPVLIWFSGPDKLCTYFNKPWLEFTGRPLNMEVGNGWTEGVHSDDLNYCFECYVTSFDHRQPFRMEYRLRRHDGQYRWILDEGVPRFNERGSFIGYIGVGIDVTEKKHAEEVLADLNRKLLETQEKERTRIGRDLHDDINQRLAMLTVEIEQLRNDVGYGSAEINQRLIELRERATDISKGVQSISHQLHSPQLEYLGIVAAIRSFCREFGERQGIRVDFESDQVPKSVSHDVSLCLFRVVQEAVHNAAQHSRSKHFNVKLSRSVNSLELLVSDHGSGFDASSAITKGGLGLISMRERVRLVNGTIKIDSQPQRGTNILVRVPLEPEEASERAAGF
jgi:PAS domain S-box-containing protein